MGTALTGGLAFTARSDADDAPTARTPLVDGSGWYNVRTDFGAVGDGVADDTAALTKAIAAGSAAQRPVFLPPGAYKTTRSLTLPPNSMLVGSTPSLGFGCTLRPTGCPAFTIGGAVPTFHCSIEDLTICPAGPAPSHIISIDNSYSLVFRNVRIYEVQERLARAAVLLLGDSTAGGHGPCMDILWDRLILRNDSSQPRVALHAAKGCGTHRFTSPVLENYQVLLEWQGGQLDLVAPYTERAGRYAVNCALDVGDSNAFLNTFGGSIDCARSGVALAIRSTTRGLSSFGTRWGASTEYAAFVYSLPERPACFYGTVPNLTPAVPGRYSGIRGWRRAMAFPDHALVKSQLLDVVAPPRGRGTATVSVPGVVPHDFWAKVTLNADTRGAHLSAFVSSEEKVTVVADNPTAQELTLSGVYTVECGPS